MPETDPTDQPESGEWGLVMPFIACTSNGGPFDDEAFVAGWQAGRINQELEVATQAVREARFCVNSQLVKQLDLVGMRHGFPVVEAEVWDEAPDWTYVTFRREAA